MRDLLSQQFIGSLTGGLVSAAVTIAGAIWLWRFQVRGKRRAEVAEEALIAFQEIADQLEYCRLSPLKLQNEHEVPLAVSTNWGEHGRDFKLVLERLSAQAHLFATIRKHQLLCEVHFGHRAGQVFADLTDLIVDLRRKAALGARLADDLETPGARLPASGERDLFAAHRQDAEQAREFVFGGSEDEMGTKLTAANATLLRYLKPAIN